jgi:hypothetical protein
MDVFRLRVIAFLTFLITFWWFFVHSSIPVPVHWTIQVGNHNTGSKGAKSGLPAANSTLGVSAIFLLAFTLQES